MYEQIIAGMITGVGYGMAGWGKNYKKGNEKSKFDWKELGKSVVICGIVGAVAGYSNQDFNLALTGTIGVGITKGFNLLYELIF